MPLRIDHYFAIFLGKSTFLAFGQDVQHRLGRPAQAHAQRRHNNGPVDQDGMLLDEVEQLLVGPFWVAQIQLVIVVLRPNPRKFQNRLFLTVPTAFDHLGAARHQAQDAGKGFAA